MRHIWIPIALVMHTGALEAADAPSLARSPRLSPVGEAADAPPVGAQSWEGRAHGVTLRLEQILPDQVRGFYLARGFDEAAVEFMATRHCFFQTVLRNESGEGAIQFDLREWRARAAGREVSPKVVAAWQPEWEQRGVAAAARTAFRWALFPAEQRYDVGDWNMGMTAFGLPPESRFDLTAVWRANGHRQKLTLASVRCASDAAAVKTAP